MQTRTVARVLGASALFTGVALLIHLLAGYSLPLALAGTTLVLIAAVVAVWTRARAETRGRLLRVAAVGLAAALVATAVYDLTKLILARLEPSPFNPFGAIPIFGSLLTGAEASTRLALAAGVTFHVVNGLCFGLAYCFLFGRRGAVAGILWGLFLETFQLILYPDWLGITLWQEFARISALSHVAYGAVLGALCRRGLRNVDGLPIPGRGRSQARP